MLYVANMIVFTFYLQYILQVVFKKRFYYNNDFSLFWHNIIV